MSENRLFLIIFPVSVLLLSAFLNLSAPTTNVGFNTNLNGQSSGLSFSGTSFKIGAFTFNFFSYSSLIAFAFLIVTIGVLAGINVIGSGLASSIPWILTITLIFLLPFSVLLALGSPVLLKMPYNLGTLIIVLLSLMYVLGIGDRLSGRGQ